MAPRMPTLRQWNDTEHDPSQPPAPNAGKLPVPSGVLCDACYEELIDDSRPVLAREITPGLEDVDATHLRLPEVPGSPFKQGDWVIRVRCLSCLKSWWRRA